MHTKKDIESSCSNKNYPLLLAEISFLKRLEQYCEKLTQEGKLKETCADNELLQNIKVNNIEELSIWTGKLILMFANELSEEEWLHFKTIIMNSLEPVSDEPLPPITNTLVDCFKTETEKKYNTDSSITFVLILPNLNNSEIGFTSMQALRKFTKDYLCKTFTIIDC